MALSMDGKPASEHRLCKKLTSHIAYALILYTIVLIGLISGLHIGEGSILPYLGLVVAVFAIIPVFRGMQKRWEKLTNAGLPEAGLEARIRMDLMKLWLIALIIPCAWAGAFALLSKV